MVNVGVVIIGLNLVRVGITMSFEKGHGSGGYGIDEKTEVIQGKEEGKKDGSISTNSVQVCTKWRKRVLSYGCMREPRWPSVAFSTRSIPLLML
jgi:hypothetical protein